MRKSIASAFPIVVAAAVVLSALSHDWSRPQLPVQVSPPDLLAPNADDGTGAPMTHVSEFTSTMHRVPIMGAPLSTSAGPAPTMAVPIPPHASPTAVEGSALSSKREALRLRKRVAWLETELDLCGSEVTRGPIGRWLAELPAEARPGAKTLRLVASYMRPYPVELLPHEGLWIAERIESDDWKDWGPTIDEALILFLGPARLERDLPPDAFASLKAEWLDEGFFGE